MKKILLRIAVYISILIVFVGGIGFWGFARENNHYWLGTRQEPIPSLNGLKVPEYNPNKPTVAVILGNRTTEVFDFMVPYEMFAMTEAFNVYAVAPDKNVKTLTGGLDIVPHYSFEEMDQLLGKSPDLIVVPFIPMVDKERYKLVREWIQKHSKTNLLSICAGAVNLANTGLLKGKSLTMPWQYMDIFKKIYPDINWIRDQRYVLPDKNIVSSAGLTSGIDAVLYVISQKLGEPMAEKIADQMNYPSYHFVKNPKVDPYYHDLSESVYIFNQAFQWNKKQMGVLLYNGMDDGALSTIFDTYAASGTTDVYTVSKSVQPIVTKYHLNLIPRFPLSNAPKLDRMIVPGTEAKSLAADDVAKWSEQPHAVAAEFLHNESTHRFIFDAPLEDLAKQEDVLTAQFGQKRLEYQAYNVHYEGNLFSFEAFGVPVLLLILAILIAYWIDRRFITKKKTVPSASSISI